MVGFIKLPGLRLLIVGCIMETCFSILIPVYNVEQYLHECFESIYNQTFNDFEVIIVDDGSTDNSGSVCDEYSKRDNRFKVIHNDNHGLIYSRRCALAHAIGEYIIFLDSDDYIDTNALSVIKKTFDQNNCDCVIYGLRQILNGSVIYTNTEEQDVTINDKQALFEKYFLTDRYNNIWRKAVRRTVFDGRDYSAYYHLQMSEDLLQSVEIIQNSKSVSFISDILYNYRVNKDSLTQTITFEKYSVNFQIREYVLCQIIHTNVLPEESLSKYFILCAERICDEIINIASFQTTKANKIHLFGEIKETDYYRSIIDRVNINRLPLKYRLVLTAFQSNMYSALIDAKQVAHFLRRSYGR